MCLDLQMNPFSCSTLVLRQSIVAFIPLLSALSAAIHQLHLLHTCFPRFQALHHHIHPHYSLLPCLITASESKPVSPDSFKRLPWFFLTDPLEEPCAELLTDRRSRLSIPHHFPSFQSYPAGGFVSLQRRCTTSQWASTYLIPRCFVARPGEQTPTSLGSMRELLSTTQWEESPKMERRCTWPRCPSAATLPARSAISWATVLPPTQQVQTEWSKRWDFRKTVVISRSYRNNEPLKFVNILMAILKGPKSKIWWQLVIWIGNIGFWQPVSNLDEYLYMSPPPNLNTTDISMLRQLQKHICKY